MKILLGDFNAKVRKEDIFKPTIRNECLHGRGGGGGGGGGGKNEVTVANLTTSKNLSRVHCSHVTAFINTLGIFLMGRLTIRLFISSRCDAKSFGVADCDTYDYLVDSEVRERQSVSKQAAKKFDMERYNLQKLNNMEVKDQYHIKIFKTFAASERK